jgi:uncharacterized membrane protein
MAKRIIIIVGTCLIAVGFIFNTGASLAFADTLIIVGILIVVVGIVLVIKTTQSMQPLQKIQT